MADISDTINEAVEHASDSRMNSIIAALVAIAATFMALCNVKDGNIVQGMAQAQANAVDQWSYYQAKGMKQNLAEATLDQLQLQRTMLTDLKFAPMLDAKIAIYEKQFKKYEKEKIDIKANAEGQVKEYERLNLHDDQFDMSDACLSVAIALFGVTALTKKRWLLGLACLFMFFGVLFGLAGFFAWKLHPDFFAKFLS
ncbi:MAG TPA: DUF4337 domain-containing protein [Thermoanaerobaculia bacterium]|jgi:hypothetical protein|nr:DUF4337 domain-containing protein [Thermoanaerobaculia bacterium]